MQGYFNAVTFLMLTAPLTALVMLGKAFLSPRSPRIWWFITMQTAIFLWSGGYYFELTSIDLSRMLFWSKIEYLGAPYITPAWFTFAMLFAGKISKYRWKNIGFIFIIPFLSTLAAFTNSCHHLLWKSVDISLTPNFSTMAVTPGAWYIVNVIYSYSLFIMATFVLIQTYLHSPPHFQWIILTLLLFSFVNWIANIAYMSRLYPDNLDLTPFVFSMSSILLGWSIFRQYSLQVIPIAREIVIENLTEGIIVIDKLRRVVDANNNALLFASRSGHIIGNFASDVFPDIFTQDVLGKMNINPRDTIETRLFLPESRKHFLIKVVPLFEDRKMINTPVGYSIIINDITELSNHAKELERKNDDLKAFSRMVAHDIKNPLNSIIGYSTMLQQSYRDLKNYEVREMAESIVKSGKKLDSIVKELFLLSSLDLDTQISMEEVDMKAVLANVMERINQIIERKKAKIILPDKWSSITSYPPWVEQIWINYISNAVKYGGDPPIIVIKEICREDEIEYIVKDNGAGLDSEEIDKIFAPFTRLGSKTEEEGTGLGLSIVKRLAERLGGTYGARSVKGSGSVFYFTLPINH